MVLVETSHPGNIGAAARAMKNMGLTRLYLVSPRLFPNDKAIWRAASAAEVVRDAVVVDSLGEALQGCQLIIGTSARERRIPWPMLAPNTCGVKVFEAARAGNEVAIVFGREAHGLKNEELQLCHYHLNIPTGKAYSSLNLAMAVQLISYEILQAKLRSDEIAEDRQSRGAQAGDASVETDNDHWDMEYATAEAVEHFFTHLESTLVQVGFHDPENPRQLLTRLRRLFNRVRMDKMEVNILRGFLTAINKLKNSN
ncbi:MAG: RNA methyltransferase [Pseudomonadales bacterium]|nr:RNA methyltransferase [Pseudomonadales bacterium]